MTRLVRRQLPGASRGAADRAMKALGLKGIRRTKGVRTTIPAKDGRRAGDLPNRDSSAAAPNRTCVMDFTHGRTWAGFVYVSFLVDVFAQTVVAGNCATSKDVEPVMVPPRMATTCPRSGREPGALHSSNSSFSVAPGSRPNGSRLGRHQHAFRPSIATGLACGGVRGYSIRGICCVPTLRNPSCTAGERRAKLEAGCRGDGDNRLGSCVVAPDRYRLVGGVR